MNASSVYSILYILIVPSLKACLTWSGRLVKAWTYKLDFNQTASVQSTLRGPDSDEAEAVHALLNHYH